MFDKILVIALAVTTASTRPQLQFFQPIQSQQQKSSLNAALEEIFSGEKTFLSNVKTVQPQRKTVNRQFINAESRIPLNINSRQSELRLEQLQSIPNQHFNNRNEFSHNTINNNQQYPSQANQFLLQNSISNNRTHQSLRQDVLQQNNTKTQSELKTNRNPSVQQNNLRPNETIYNRNRPTIVQANQHKDINHIYNQPPKTNVINQTMLYFNKNGPAVNQSTASEHDVMANKQFFVNSSQRTPDTDQNRKTVNANDTGFNRRPSNSSDQKPVYSANPPASAVPNVSKPGSIEGRTSNDSMSGDDNDDRWVWGMADVTATTPDVDDRAAFDGDACPTGQVKLGTKCVSEE